MTVTHPTVDHLTEAIVAGAQAATRALPATADWLVEPTADVVLPPEGAAVTADLGAFGRLVLVASPTLARAVQVGPPPADDLAEGLTPALEGAAESLDQLGDIELTLGQPVEGDAATVAAPGSGEIAVTATLLDGDQHAATLVLITTAPVEDEVQAGAAGHQFADIDAPASVAAAGGPLELLHEVEMGITAELGRARMLVRDILDLSPGSVIELDRSAGAPVDVLVNGTLIARGEVVVIDEEFGIRVTEVVGYDDPNEKRRR